MSDMDLKIGIYVHGTAYCTAMDHTVGHSRQKTPRTSR